MACATPGMPFRRLQRRLQLGERLRGLLPQDEVGVPDVDSVCRFCWQGPDVQDGGELLAPCRCSGSVKFVHRRCLGAWQRTQRSQGAFRKSYRCDICRERYRIPRAAFSGLKLPFGRLPTVEETKELVFSFIGSPLWQVVLDVWKAVVLANGLLYASTCGVMGLEKGFWLAWQSVLYYGNVMIHWGPEVLMAAAAFPVVQLPVILLTVGSGAFVGMELVGAVLVGWYAGALYGFMWGAMQVLRTTVNLSGEVAATGAGMLACGFGAVARASSTVAMNVVPFIRAVCQAIAAFAQ